MLPGMEDRPSWLVVIGGLTTMLLFYFVLSGRTPACGLPAAIHADAAMHNSDALRETCMPAEQLNAEAKQARGEYQAFLLEDAKRFHVARMQWAGYAGPWIENAFIEHFDVLRAKGVNTGDRLYVPLTYADCFHHCTAEQKAALRGYYQALKPEYRYFSVAQLDKGLQYSEITVPRGLDMVFFSSAGTSRGVRTVALPLLKQELQSKGLPKDIGVSFIGDLGTHAIRRDMEQQLKDQGYQFGSASNEETFDIVERSNFTLAPRGHGATSFRQFEALQLLSVPIYIWDYDLFLPFQELLDWNDIAIVVHRREIHSIPQRIAAFNLERAQQLMAENRHLWTYKYNCEYIVQRLQRERCFPIPFSTWTDILGRD